MTTQTKIAPPAEARDLIDASGYSARDLAERFGIKQEEIESARDDGLIAYSGTDDNVDGPSFSSWLRESGKSTWRPKPADDGDPKADAEPTSTATDATPDATPEPTPTPRPKRPSDKALQKAEAALKKAAKKTVEKRRSVQRAEEELAAIRAELEKAESLAAETIAASLASGADVDWRDDPGAVAVTRRLGAVERARKALLEAWAGAAAAERKARADLLSLQHAVALDDAAMVNWRADELRREIERVRAEHAGYEQRAAEVGQEADAAASATKYGLIVLAGNADEIREQVANDPALAVDSEGLENVLLEATEGIISNDDVRGPERLRVEKFTIFISATTGEIVEHWRRGLSRASGGRVSAELVRRVCGRWRKATPTGEDLRRIAAQHGIF